MGRKAEDTRARLVEAAERLFAERGIEAVSLRDVSAAAGQRNHSATQYHFVDRAGLVAAVFDARMRLINDRRLSLLAELDRQGRGHDLILLVTAFVQPLVDIVTETGGWYARFLVRARWDPFATDVLRDLPVVSSARETTRRLHEALGDLPAPLRHSRIEKLNTLVIGTVAAWEWSNDRDGEPLAARLMGDDLITTSLAVLTAPAPPATTHA